MSDNDVNNCPHCNSRIRRGAAYVAKRVIVRLVLAALFTGAGSVGTLIVTDDDDDREVETVEYEED